MNYTVRFELKVAVILKTWCSQNVQLISFFLDRKLMLLPAFTHGKAIQSYIDVQGVLIRM